MALGAIIAAGTTIYNAYNSYGAAGDQRDADEARADAIFGSSYLMEDAAILGFEAALDNAFLIREEADIVFDDYVYAANNKENEIENFVKSQKMSFIASGVETTGTPSLVMAEDLRKGYEESDRLIYKGARLRNLKYMQAAIMEKYAGAELEIGFGEAALTRESGEVMSNIADSNYSSSINNTIGSFISSSVDIYDRM